MRPVPNGRASVPSVSSVENRMRSSLIQRIPITDSPLIGFIRQVTLGFLGSSMFMTTM